MHQYLGIATIASGGLLLLCSLILLLFSSFGLIESQIWVTLVALTIACVFGYGSTFHRASIETPEKVGLGIFAGAFLLISIFVWNLFDIQTLGIPFMAITLYAVFVLALSTFQTLYMKGLELSTVWSQRFRTLSYIALGALVLLLIPFLFVKDRSFLETLLPFVFGLIAIDVCAGVLAPLTNWWAERK